MTPAAASLWDAIRQLVAAGTDVLLSTQYLEEADRLAADIVIIDHGKVIAAGTPAELKTQAGDDVLEVHLRDAESLSGVAAVLAAVGRDPQVDPATRRVSVAVDDGTRRLLEAVRALDHGGVAIEDLSLRRPTLDESSSPSPARRPPSPARRAAPRPPERKESPWPTQL